MSWRLHEYSRAHLLSQRGQWLSQGCGTVIGWLAQLVEALAFWTAVGLHALYVPVLAGGLTGQEAFAMGGLLAVNVVALVAGHDYAREPTS